MRTPSLRAGSDGFRGVIGDSFSLSELNQLAGAIVSYFKESGAPAGATLPIGFDTRFLAEHFARLLYVRLANAGFRPLLSSRCVPSPYLSFAVKHLQAPMGLMLTASHNPARYLGLKPKGPEGGSALPEVQERIAELAKLATISEGDPADVFSLSSEWEHFDVRAEYSAALNSLLIREALVRDFRLTVDFMHGAAASVYGEVMEELGVGFVSVHNEPDPLFAEGKPEPIPPYLDELVAWVLSGSGESIGAAFDGDGDRLGLIDEGGEIVPNEDIFAACLLHLIEDRNLRGRIVKTVSFSGLIDRLAAAFDLPVAEIPVGFKHATRELMTPETLAAGEESGGLGFGFYLPERDALLALLLILEAITMRGKGLRELRDELAERFGKSYFYREDIPLANSEQAVLVRQRMDQLAAAPGKIAPASASVDRLDGIKLRHDQGFLLVRLSGTEPLLRIYCDDTREGRERELVGRAREFLLDVG